MPVADKRIALEDRLRWAFSFAAPYVLILGVLKAREVLAFGIGQIETWHLIKVAAWLLAEFLLVLALFRAVAGLRATIRVPVSALLFFALSAFSIANHEILRRLSIPINLFVISKTVGFFMYLGGYFAETEWAVLLGTALVGIAVLPILSRVFLAYTAFRLAEPAHIAKATAGVGLVLILLAAIGPPRPAAISYLPASAMSIAYELSSRAHTTATLADPTGGAFLDGLRRPIQLAPELEALPGKAAGMNVVFYLLETNAYFFLRPDGPFAELTPNFQRLAGQSLRLEDHHNVSMLSIASLYNLLSSSYASASGNKYRFLFLEDHPVARLKRAGYSVGMFTSSQLRFDFLGYTLKEVLGFDHVFDSDQVNAPDYRTQGVWFEGAAVFDDRVVIDKASEWIAEQPGEKPFFSILWPQNSHAPYWSPPERDRRLSGSEDLDRFLNSLAYQDHLLGLLIDELERQGITDNTLVVITADHGIKHGFRELPETAEHGSISLLRETDTHMPALIFHPGLFPQARSYEKLTSHLDLLPTVLDLLDVSYDRRTFDGRSIFSGEQNRVVRIGWGFDGRYVGFVTRDYKFKHDRLSNASEVLRRASPASVPLDGDGTALLEEFERLAESWRDWEISQMRLR